MLKIPKSFHNTPYASVPNSQENALTKKIIYNIKNSCTQQLNDISSTKYIQQNMLNKLLRVPVKKQNKGKLRKYDPQFVKPDIEKLNDENIQFKNKINEDQKMIKELKFKVKELTRKIQKLQMNCVEQQEDALEKNKKNSSVHTEILNKKIHELHIKCINAETQIKRLKKLPNASIYQQSNIQKQHLLAENIRLKSILTSSLNPSNYSEQNQINTSLPLSINNKNFQQQFVRMLKQQNEKLKATIRLLQNDKILMKARQTTQNKQTNDLKKQLQNVRNKLILKQAQIQKLTHQNQNLLFKKATKFRLQKELKQNELILQLTKNIEQLRCCIKKLQSQKSQLEIDNLDLKKKQQNKNNGLIQKDKQLQKLKIQLSQIRNQYDVRIKSLQMNKFYSNYSNFAAKSSNAKVFQLIGQEFEKQDITKNRYNNQHKFNRQDQPNKKFNWGKPIKFQQLDLCLLKIWALKQDGIIINFQDIFNRFTSSQTNQDSIITFQQLYNILKCPPLFLTSNQSLKLSKYIFSDHSDYPNPSLHPNQPVIHKSLAFTIIKAAVSKFTECLLNPNVLSLWKCFLSRSRKFIQQLEDNENQVINKQQFINILLRNKNSGLQFEEINFMVLHGFSRQCSNGEQIMLNKKKLVKCLEGLILSSEQKLHLQIFNNDNQNELKQLNKNQLKKQKQQCKNNQPLEKQKNNKEVLIQANSNTTFKNKQNSRFVDENIQDNESNSRDNQQKTANLYSNNKLQKQNHNNMYNDEQQVEFSELNEGDFNQLFGQIQMEEQENKLLKNYQNIHHNRNYEQQQQKYQNQQNQDQQSQYDNL